MAASEKEIKPDSATVENENPQDPSSSEESEEEE